ncbi:hypothetical protein [Desulfosarcina variabilis]|uniref:hypothetical protein n=1 Tax=Desulfosarcina variabilis TaxID=2300 RepID=UPI003AFB506D
MYLKSPSQPTERYAHQPYLPPDPNYFDYENRYRPAVSSPLYTAVDDPMSATYTPGIEEFLRQKQDLNRYKIEMLYTAMGVRSYISGQLLYRINYDQCTCRNLILSRGGEFFDRQRIDLENKILDLEAEKRREETAFFRDLSFLNKELRFAKIEALEEQHKQALCQNMEESI